MLRDALAIRMTSDQLVEAQKLVREWKPLKKISHLALPRPNLDTTRRLVRGNRCPDITMLFLGGIHWFSSSCQFPTRCLARRACSAGK